MNKTKFDHMVFKECGCDASTDIVGSTKIFKSKDDFIDFAFKEYDYEFDDAEKPDPNNVTIDYIRYFPKMPFGFEIESGYTFCRKAKGAVEVYRLRL